MRNAITYLLVSLFLGCAAECCVASDGLKNDELPTFTTFTAVMLGVEDAIRISFLNAEFTTASKSITMSDGDQTLVITASHDGLELATGAVLIRAKDFRLFGRVVPKNLDNFRIRPEHIPTKLIDEREETEPSHSTEPAVESAPKSPH